MSWFYLAMAIIFELSGTISMKLSKGFSILLPSVLIFVFYGISFVFVTLAVKEIDTSVSYAIWSGIGTAAIAIIGYYYFGEPMGLKRIISVGLIIAGVIGLRLT